MKTTLFAIGLGLLLTFVAAPAEAEPIPTMYCMPVYSEEHVGPVTVVRRDSCAVPEVYVSEPFSRPDMPLPFYCMQVYTEETVGPVTVVRRNSCAVPEVYVSEPFARPGMPVDIYCAQVYTEQDVGPVTVIQTSSCSVPRAELNDEFDAGTFSNPVDPGCTWSLNKMDVAGVVVPVPAKCHILNGI